MKQQAAKNSQSKHVHRLAAISAAAIWIAARPVQATTLTWNGGASGNWNTNGTNQVWLDGTTATPWVAGSDAFFGTFGGEVAVTLTEGVTASSVQAAANASGDGAQAVRITGAHTLTLTGAGDPPLVGLNPATLTLKRRRSLVIEADIEVSGSPTGIHVFDANDGLASDILDLQGNIAGSDNINFRIAINPLVRISGDNSSYTGRMELRAATTEIGSDTALGAGAAATVIGSGGDTPLLRAIDGTRTITNALTREVSSSARLNRFEGDFHFTGALSLSNNNQPWRVDVVSGTTSFQGGVTTGSGHILRKEGAGTLVFTGNSTPFGGGVQVSNGVLRIDGTWGNQKNYTIRG